MIWDAVSPEVAIIACGALIHNVLLAASELTHQGSSVLVLNLHTIKPIDERAVIDVARRAGAVLIVEEHQVAGGMGSAVAEVLARTHPVPMDFVGVDDKFGESGDPGELIEHFGMGVKSIMNKAQKLIKRKHK